MRKLTYLLTIILGLLAACNSKNSSTSRLLPEPDIIEKLKYEKSEIDTLFKNGKGECLTFLKLTENGQSFLLETDTIPEEAITTYYILKDSLGKVITISELPTSESGDWFIVYTHYFDKTGKTFAFERQTNFFNSNCTDGIAYETKTELYNSDFKIINKTYNLVDEKNNPLNKDSCSLLYDYKYCVSPNIDYYLKTNKIKLYD
jgi:hypothetical protein